MIVYHGSNMVVDHPDVNHSYRDLDFGRGFYVTTVKEQAEKWAKRKAGFSKENGRAILGIWEKSRALKEIRVYPSYDQIAFITQAAVDGLLTFRSSQEVSL